MVRPVPAVDVGAIDALPDHPLVITGFTPAARCGAVDDLFAAVGNPVIHGCRDGAVYEYVSRPAVDVAAMFRAGILDFNVTDSYVDDEADPDERLTIPPPIENGNLLKGTDETRYFRKCLVL